MIYGSLCSGIEAATVAWHPLRWNPAYFAEIEPFPCAVLKHHYPEVPNYGDITKYKEWPEQSIDLLVGGTPCQSFSVAGLRKGLADPRGNLMLVYLGILDKYRPRWMVWENVPGVLSSGGGRDFGTFLGALGELGYGWAYRILDAQFFGVAQRRRRVFVIGYLGNWRPAAAVLFERNCLSGYPPPRRKTGQRVAAGFEIGPGGNNEVDIAPTLDAHCKDGPIRNQIGLAVAHTLMAKSNCSFDSTLETYVTHTLKAEYDASEDGTGRGTPLVPVAIHPHCIGRAPDAGPQGKEYIEDGSAYTMDSRGAPQCVAFMGGQGAKAGSIAASENISPTLRATDSGSNRSPNIQSGMMVRRLTPRECERLQGFPDDYTLIPWRGKPAVECPDGPRYKALGNSMAVPCMRWIGQRIKMVDCEV